MKPGTRQPRNESRRPSRPGPVPDQPRRLAYDVLHEVGAADAYANLELQRVLAGQTQRDAAFITELVNGVLRNRRALDAVLQRCVDRALAKLDPRVLDVLRLGAYQWLFLHTAQHACVSTSVELVADIAGPAPKSLVNAVLRRVVARSGEGWLSELAAKGDLGERWSHPQWIIDAFTDALGPDRTDELSALLEINNEPPLVTLVARPGLCEVDELLAAGGTVGRWGGVAVTAPAGKVNAIKAVRDGRAGVQDEGSQLVTQAFTAAPISGRDERWVDLCAGPGGKSALLAAIGAQRGVDVLAVDRHLHKAKLVRANLKATAGNAWAVVGDGRAAPTRDADRVLVDAPCTGLGVLRRRPEIRWRRRPADVGDLARLQTELLRSAISVTRSGGVIGYATCSPHIAETDLVVAAVVRDGDVEQFDAREFLPGVPDVGPGPAMRLWPHLHGTDGMYLALLRRR